MHHVGGVRVAGRASMRTQSGPSLDRCMVSFSSNENRRSHLPSEVLGLPPSTRSRREPTFVLPLSAVRRCDLQAAWGNALKRSPVVPSRCSSTPILRARATTQLLGVSVKTVRNWEQGQRQPKGAARSLLLVAYRHPEAVLDTLSHEVIAASPSTTAATVLST